MSKTDGHSLSFGFDALGRNTSAGANSGTFTYQYDLAGRRTRVTHPGGGFYVDYDYLVTGEVSAIRENGATSGAGVIATFGYDDLGRRVSLTRGNGTVTSYGYDAVSRLSSLGQDLAGTSHDVTATFTHDPANGIASRTRSHPGYAYIQFVNGSVSDTINGLNQVTATGSSSVGHDARGNITAIGSTGYGYDVENWMTNGGGMSQLYADPAGRLIRTLGGSDTRFAWDGNDLALELDPSGNVLRRYVHGRGTDEPLVWYEGSGTGDRRWLHADERGSVIAVSNGSGSAIATYSFDEYGVPGGGIAGRFGYTGQLWLPELAAYYYKARIYNPALGRFMQTDPIGYGDGLNLYNYVGDDPVNFTDPSGTQVVDVTITGSRFNGSSGGFWGISDGTGFVGNTGALADDPETINIIRSRTRSRSAGGVIYFPAPGSSVNGGNGTDEGLVAVVARPRSSGRLVLPAWDIAGQPNPCMVAIGQGAWKGITNPEALIGDAIGAGAVGAANAGKVAKAAFPLGRALNIARASGAGAALTIAGQGVAGAVWAYFTDKRCR